MAANKAGQPYSDVDWTELLAQLIDRQERMADQQARDAWLLEALTEKIDQLASLSGAAETSGVVDALPAALGALTGRLEAVASGVAELVRAVEDDRAAARSDMRTLADAMEARASARETRLAEAAAERLEARAEAFLGKPTELVASVVCKAVEDVSTELTRLGVELKEDIAAQGGGDAGGIASRIEALDAAARRRAAALESGLTEQGAAVAASTARLDTMFDRLDRIDARTETLGGGLDADQVDQIVASRIAEASEAARATLGEAIEASVAQAFGAAVARIDGDVAQRVEASVSKTMTTKLAAATAEIGAGLSAELAETVAEQVADAAEKARDAVSADLSAAMSAGLADARADARAEARAEAVTAAKSGLSALKADLSRQARELSELSAAFSAVEPLGRASAQLDALLGRLAALPAEVAAVETSAPVAPNDEKAARKAPAASPLADADDATGAAPFV